jgi:hypothetical protein
MAHPLIARYRDRAGAEHEIRIERAPSGRWRVLDGDRPVEELTGSDDHRPQAEALARDYAAQATLAARGGRDDEHEIDWAA